MVGADLRTLPEPMSRTTSSNAFMSAVNNREAWMWDPWSDDNVAGDDDVELDGWNLVPARRSPYGTRGRAPASRAKRRWTSPTTLFLSLVGSGGSAAPPSGFLRKGGAECGW